MYHDHDKRRTGTVGRQETWPVVRQPPKWWCITVATIDTCIGAWSGQLAAVLLIPMMLAPAYEVCARHLFHAPTGWAYDATYMLYGSHFMLGAAFTLYRRQHLRAVVLYQTLSVRGQGIVDTFFYLFMFFPAMALLTVIGWTEALESRAIGERMGLSAWSPAAYPFKCVMPVAAALLFLQGISEFLKSLYAAFQGRPLASLSNSNRMR